MNLRAYWQFYKAIFLFIASFSIVSIAFAGVLWGFVLFAILGLPFGILGFQVFYKEQFYFYYNLGLTKWKLFKVSFVINLLIGIPVFSVLILFITFIIGDFKIT